LLTGPYRAELEAAGWDADLLAEPAADPAATRPGGAVVDGARPDPGVEAGPATRPDPRAVQEPADRPAQQPVRQPVPGPASPAPAEPAGVVQVAVRERPLAPAQRTVVCTTSAAHPLRTELRALPGATWDGQGAWLLPLTRRTALALRRALTGHRVQLLGDAREALRAAADSPAGPDVTVVEGPGAERSLAIRFEHTAVLQDDVKRTCAARWDGSSGSWRADADKVDDVARFAHRHGLVLDAGVEALAAERDAPLRYDGTVDGLRGVPVTELHAVRSKKARGKTPSLAERLAEFGIESVYDLLMHVPLRYLDRSTVLPIRKLREHVGETVGLLARIDSVGQYDRTKRLLRVQVNDGTAALTVTFFNSPWLARRYRPGDEVSVYGRVEAFTPRSGKPVLQMTNPLMDPIGDNPATIVPVYNQSAKSNVTTWDLHSAAGEAVRRLGELSDPLPAEVRERHALVDRAEAYRQVHHPDDLDVAARARDRLAFDELLRMQIALGLRRHATAAETGVAHAPTGELTGAFLARLPFPLTGAQTRALEEVRTDLTRPHPMHRLLQGDVGSGKTVVAAMSLLMAVEGGYQGALMAPTEILATQLHTELAERLAGTAHPDGRPLVVEFLGSKTRAKDRRRILADLAAGAVDVLVGTHALLVEDVLFARLGLVVVDEQHRFGVEQRAALRAKGAPLPGTDGDGDGDGERSVPDMLIMTATPIPRTAALTVFGDLSVTVLDELPPGRTPITTRWVPQDPAPEDEHAEAWTLVREQVAQGRQAYVVASLVEDNEKLAAQAATSLFEALGAGALADLRLGLVHGKQDRAQREGSMAAFKRGEIDVLVATTVIEVGVNVPNATVMVVVDAARFGIAQLHQIRGRVGRGRHASHCLLTGRASSADSVARLQALEASTDGFHLSEVDLDLRGGGSLFGNRQSGQSDLRVADLKADLPMVQTARAEADLLLDGDPVLARRPQLLAEVRNALGEDAAERLARS
ncbi:ATP-dependent DNA helicase RecG, partial [Kineococcus indalonis]|uniref:ATP-dependent DNA helicase RecG n=1 Tax=Kineococcus indalonis TaxID=2696566 RepID=UPI00141347CB